MLRIQIRNNMLQIDKNDTSCSHASISIEIEWEIAASLWLDIVSLVLANAKNIKAHAILLTKHIDAMEQE